MQEEGDSGVQEEGDLGVQGQGLEGVLETDHGSGAPRPTCSPHTTPTACLLAGSPRVP